MKFSKFVNAWERAGTRLAGYGISKIAPYMVRKEAAKQGMTLAAGDMRNLLRSGAKDLHGAIHGLAQHPYASKYMKAAPWVFGGVAAGHGIGAVRHTRDHRYGRAALSVALGGAAAMTALTSRTTFSRMGDAVRLGMNLAARNAGRL